MIIGVLAIQGAYQEHIETLNKIKEYTIESKLVKTKQDFNNLDALIIPGGESTVLSKFIVKWNLFDTILEFTKNKPVFGTCAGAILLSKNGLLKVTDIELERNAYGSQINSFMSINYIKNIGNFNCIFIRAPKIINTDYLEENSTNLNIDILSKNNNNIILIKQNNILLCTFHPELENSIIHEYFINNFVI